MGSDIHYTFQKKENGIWKDIDGLERGYDENWKPKEFNIGRNYILFSVLAGVRNRWDIKPIAEPRGLPEGIQEEYDDEYQEWYNEYGDHSYSWLTSTEILQWFADHKTYIITESGIVTREEFHSWDGVTPFDCYSQSIGGPNIKVLDSIENNYLLNFNLKAYNDYTHVRVQWKEDIIPSIKYFEDMISKLHLQYGEVRFVFGFDS